MSASGKKRKTLGKKAPPDFKRLKARVGKKVQKQAHETETAFKAASLYVTGQSIQRQSADVILSAKGKSLMELSLLLSHPAVNARLSALKGLINIAKQHASIVLRPHLYVLVQSCSKGLVDEDKDVRRASLSLLDEVLPKHKQSTRAPFLPLLVAYTSSALHSLDPQMRLDGARAIDRLSFFFPTLITCYSSSLLAPFAVLLSDRKNEDLHCSLKALASLLRNFSSIKTEGRHRTTLESNETPDFFYSVGGRTRNFFLKSSDDFLQSSQGYNTSHGLVADNFTAQIDRKSLLVAPRKDTNSGTLLKIFHDLQSRLRDVLLEMVEQDSAGQPMAKSLSNAGLQSLIDSIRLVWMSQCSKNCSQKGGNTERLALQTAGLLMELFPISGGICIDAKEGDVAALNSSIAVTVIDVGSIVSDDYYVSSGIAKLNENLRDYWLAAKRSNSKYIMPASQLEVMDSMLLALARRKGGNDGRRAILQSLYDCFFHSPDREAARSAGGRKAAVILADEALKNCLGAGERSILAASTQKLPFFLEAWDSDFNQESYAIINSLVRTAANPTHWQDDSMLEYIRDGLTSVVAHVPPATRKRGKHRSVYESYPVWLRRKVLGLIRMLESPSKGVLKGLALTCSTSAEGVFNQSPHDESINAESFETIFSIRKTIAMPDFLSFVVSSIGAPKTTIASTPPQNLMQENYICALDIRTMRASRAMVSCGSQQIFEMLEPQFLAWLDTSYIFHAQVSVLRQRVVLSLVSLLLIDNLRSGCTSDSLEEGSNFFSLLVKATCHAFELVAKSRPTSDVERRLLSPYLIFLEMVPVTRRRVSDHLLNYLEREETSEGERTKLQSFITTMNVETRTKSRA